MSALAPLIPNVFETLHSGSINLPMFLVFVTLRLNQHHLWSLMTPLLAVVATVSL